MGLPPAKKRQRVSKDGPGKGKRADPSIRPLANPKADAEAAKLVAEYNEKFRAKSLMEVVSEKVTATLVPRAGYFLVHTQHMHTLTCHAELCNTHTGIKGERCKEGRRSCQWEASVQAMEPRDRPAGEQRALWMDGYADITCGSAALSHS